MIKKSTVIVFEDGEEQRTENLNGGIPLSKGDIVHIHDESGVAIDYEVVNKKIDLTMKGTDQILDIHYLLRRVK